jgi:hypothetical protein
MKHLNWKDRGEGSEARAGREVGGYYRITYRESYVSALGLTIEAHYEVEYRRSVRRDWDEIEYPRGVLGFDTLAEAKRMAEEDREQRGRELLSDDEATLDAIHQQQLAVNDPGEPEPWEMTVDDWMHWTDEGAAAFRSLAQIETEARRKAKEK